jgi:hypothetical protein
MAEIEQDKYECSDSETYSQKSILIKSLCFSKHILINLTRFHPLVVILKITTIQGQRNLFQWGSGKANKLIIY